VLPRTLEARGEGWAPIVRARVDAAGADLAQTLLVAPAAELLARVLDEAGAPLAGAALELTCDESAFARVPRPIQLESAVLRAFAADAEGALRSRTCRARPACGCACRAGGCAPLVRATSALAREELFVLAALPRNPCWPATCGARTARPAVGAGVRLAQASTTRMPRGASSCRCAASRRTRPRGQRRPRRLGAAAALRRAPPPRWHRRPRRLVLGDEHDPVAGELTGPAADGWLVVVYPEEHAALDADGREQPAATAHSDAAGRFALSLPHGAYELYALAPEGLRVARLGRYDTRRAAWRAALPPAAPLESVRGLVHSDDGRRWPTRTSRCARVSTARAGAARSPGASSPRSRGRVRLPGRGAGRDRARGRAPRGRGQRVPLRAGRGGARARPAAARVRAARGADPRPRPARARRRRPRAAGPRPAPRGRDVRAARRPEPAVEVPPPRAGSSCAAPVTPGCAFRSRAAG
jgi:hypothetical protein